MTRSKFNRRECSIIYYLDEIIARVRVAVGFTQAHDFNAANGVLHSDGRGRFHFQYSVIFGWIRRVHFRVVPEFDSTVHAYAGQLRVTFRVQKHNDRGQVARLPPYPRYLDVYEFFVPN